MTRFRRELEVTSQLRHPSTIRVYEHGETDDGRPYMVMELLTGQSLAERLEQGRVLRTLMRPQWQKSLTHSTLPSGQSASTSQSAGKQVDRPATVMHSSLATRQVAAAVHASTQRRLPVCGWVMQKRGASHSTSPQLSSPVLPPPPPEPLVSSGVSDSPLELSSALLVLSLELDDDELSLEDDEESPVDEVGALGDASSGMPQAARSRGSRVQRRMTIVPFGVGAKEHDRAP